MSINVKNVKIIGIFSAFKKNVAKERNIEIISTTCQWPRYYYLEIFASEIALWKHFTFMTREFKQVFIKICLILQLFLILKASSFIDFDNACSGISIFIPSACLLIVQTLHFHKYIIEIKSLDITMRKLVICIA